ncbi:trehalose-phosphate synthase [bacterium BMS3Bbin06]|nr:trehalose-phosphate synthase [bacterium BMS3Abin08]GBE34246.1 trehalose-phosphate synthase [bacterium BMS3Bbin06]HDY71349.1 bifunctional alpha,alpha-trehalose-phosphate synthase (UDP-forming)/trehalose-phosphatase [Nitrospirota bacterium]
MHSELKNFIEKEFNKRKKLILVSNREPYVHKLKSGGIVVEHSAGGVTTALDDVLRFTGGIWTAWGSGSADRLVVGEDDIIEVPPDDPSYTLKRVWFTKRVLENYYHGFSNRVLWPLCHISLDRVYYRRKYWEDYIKANFIFSNAISPLVDNNSILWVHDYHLCMLPRIMRERFPSLTIAHFWHIPWPDWDVFRACPQSQNILEGLLGNDIIGFQLPLFVKNFLDCVKETLDAEVDYENGTILYRDQHTFLRAFPISIDYSKFNSLSSTPTLEKTISKLKKRLKLPELTGIGVDRLEYTKGLIKRLQALDLFFEKHEKYRNRFTFIQIAVSTRMQEPYLSYRKAVEALILKIQRRYATDTWTPIIYIDKKIEQKNLVAYYRMADIAIISSLYDGMNLVAKEYVASQVELRGVLLLSGLAGAAEELEGAIRVNPYDVENFADSINIALKMPREERETRMKTLRRHVSDNDIYKWILEIFRTLISTSEIKENGRCNLFDKIDSIVNYIKNTDIFLFIDYDGTLTPIVDLPENAHIPEETRTLLVKLHKYIPVTIITGRTLEDIRKRVDIEDIIYAGNHGAEIWDGKKVVHTQRSDHNLNLIREILDNLKKNLSDIKGVIVEDKGITASIHYRNVWDKHIGELFRRFWLSVKGYEDRIRITSGKKVFEIRPIHAWNKGDAVKWILSKYGKNRTPLYIGDDVTDEDAYDAIRGKGISINVGLNSRADYYLDDQYKVMELLNQILSSRR